MRSCLNPPDERAAFIERVQAMKGKKKDSYLWAIVLAVLLAVLAAASLSGCGTAKGVFGDAEYFFHGAGTLAGDCEDAYK